MLRSAVVIEFAKWLMAGYLQVLHRYAYHVEENYGMYVTSNKYKSKFRNYLREIKTAGEQTNMI